MTKDQTIAALVSMRESELRKVREAVRVLVGQGFDSVDAAVLIMQARTNRGMVSGGYIPTRESLLAREAQIRADREADRIQRETLRQTYNSGIKAR